MCCQPANWASVAFLLVVGGAAVVYYRYQQDKLQNTIRVETIGTPLLGGPFNLVDDTGKVSCALCYAVLHQGRTAEWGANKIACVACRGVMTARLILPLFSRLSPPQRVSSESLKGKYILLYFGQKHILFGAHV